MNEEIKQTENSKQKIKTNGDKIRSMSDEELARLCITSHWDHYNDNGMLYQSALGEGTYTTFNGVYKANLKWLKKEHKGD